MVDIPNLPPPPQPVQQFVPKPTMRERLRRYRRPLLIGTALLGVLIIGGIIYLLWPAKMVSADEARSACDTQLQNLRSRVGDTANLGSVITGKRCAVEQDEMGSNDYLLCSYLTFTKSTISDADKRALIGRLQGQDYPIEVKDLAIGGLVVTTTRYLNNDGSYILQPGQTAGAKLDSTPVVQTSDDCSIPAGAKDL